MSNRLVVETILGLSFKLFKIVFISILNFFYLYYNDAFLPE